MDNPGIQIRDTHYQLPTLDTFTLDEEHILYMYADCVVRDFIPAHPEATDEEKQKYERIQILRFRNPKFKQSLAAVALQRAHPEMESDEVWALAGEANALEADIAALWGDGPDPPATTSQKQPENTTPISELSRSMVSGRSTTSGLDPAAESRETTGTSASDTSSRGVPPIELVS